MPWNKESLSGVDRDSFPPQFGGAFGVLDQISNLEGRAREHLEVLGWKVGLCRAEYFVFQMTFCSPGEVTREIGIAPQFHFVAFNELGSGEARLGIYLKSNFVVTENRIGKDVGGEMRVIGPLPKECDLLAEALKRGLLPNTVNTAANWWLLKSHPLRRWLRRHPRIYRWMPRLWEHW